MSSTDQSATNGKKTGTPRRIQRRKVALKFHVDDDTFATEADANLWADMLLRAEKRLATTQPDLTDARAKSRAREMAEALVELAKETGMGGADSGETEDDSPADSSSTSYTNGAATDTDSSHVASH